MKSSLSFFAFLFIIMVGCNISSNHNQINIIANGFADSTMLYLYEPDLEVNIDSSYIINSKTQFSLENTEPVMLLLHTGFNDWANFQNIQLWKEKELLSVIFENGKFQDAVVTGSEVQSQMEKMNAELSPFENGVDSLWSLFESIAKNESEKRDEVYQQIRTLHQKIDDLSLEFVRSNPNYLYSAVTLSYSMLGNDNELTTELFEAFSPDVKASEFGQRIERFLEISRDIEIGDMAIDFTLPDLDGNGHRLSDFNGKYVLLGFWSSGCGGCVMEVPNLVKNYEKYSEEGFEIVNVFLDRNRDRWKDAVEQNGMKWITLSDSKGFDGDVPMIYKIQYVPKTYLLDKEGMVIAEDLRGGQLGAKLEEIFAN